MSIEPRPPVLHPAHFIVAPSKAPSPWIGTWEPDARYSNQQLIAMVSRGMNPAIAEAVRVKRKAVSGETSWPFTQPVPVHEYDCPIVQRRADGRLIVLGPAGITTLVFADGWARQPKKRGWGR